VKLWPFKSSPFLSAVEEEWQAAVWRWFLRHLGGLVDFRQSPFVTPNAAFFPATNNTGHARALAIFAMVKEHAGLQEWECELIEQPSRPDARVGEVTAQVFDKHDPLGTFGPEGNKIVITYDPGLLDDPMALIATFIHELGHYLLHAQPEPPPGGEETEELATDLVTVYLGFGLFGANSAFNFQQYTDTHSQGWRTSRQGYLNERMWCYALAIFFLLRGEDIAQAKPFLKSHLYSDLRKATAYLRKHPERLPSLSPHGGQRE
jgi:hypothetical protein